MEQATKKRKGREKKKRGEGAKGKRKEQSVKRNKCKDNREREEGAEERLPRNGMNIRLFILWSVSRNSILSQPVSAAFVPPASICLVSFRPVSAVVFPHSSLRSSMRRQYLPPVLLFSSACTRAPSSFFLLGHHFCSPPASRFYSSLSLSLSHPLPPLYTEPPRN